MLLLSDHPADSARHWQLPVIVVGVVAAAVAAAVAGVVPGVGNPNMLDGSAAAGATDGIAHGIIGFGVANSA